MGGGGCPLIRVCSLMRSNTVCIFDVLTGLMVAALSIALCVSGDRFDGRCSVNSLVRECRQV